MKLPNFSHIPINAPKCPFAHFQQDGHMAMINPKGRVNYEPNSWGDGEARESKARGFVSFKAPEEGIKERTRSLSFADHYSQASLFYLSQDAHEQDHIAQALIFELSKVETPAIRLRMVSHLPHINKDLANKVLRGLGIKEKLLILKPLVSPKKPGTMSPALSILKSNPLTFAGRKLGILVSSGTDDKILSAFKKQVLTQQATFEIIAPTIEGIISKNEKVILVNHILEGAPSALFDAVALLPSAQGLKKISHLPSLHSFLKDAFNHQKFIAYSKEAAPLMAEMGIDEKRDEGLICVGTVEKIKHFLSLCKALRHWGRII
jgi:catalase